MMKKSIQLVIPAANLRFILLLAIVLSTEAIHGAGVVAGKHRHWHHRRLAQKHHAPRRLEDRSVSLYETLTVLEFGAAGDGLTNDTEAFLSAWDHACQSWDGGLLLVPAGRQFLVGPTVDFVGTYCAGSVTMQVDGEILAPQEPAWWGGGSYRWIYFTSVNNFRLMGSGTINGRGQTWWDQSCKTNPYNSCVAAPRAVTFSRSINVAVTGLTFINSQTMHLDFDECDRVFVSDVTVSAPETSPNTDGIHLQNTPNAVIQNCNIGTGDDCISLQTGSNNVLIQGITCGPGHGISIGGLGKDNAYAQISDVRVYNVTFTASTNGLRIKSWQGGSGVATNISYEMVQMNDVQNPIIINQYYCDDLNPCENQTSAVQISNIFYDNIVGTTATPVAVNFACSDVSPCENLVMQNIYLTQTSGEMATSFCESARGVGLGNLQPPSCLSY